MYIHPSNLRLYCQPYKTEMPDARTLATFWPHETTGRGFISPALNHFILRSMGVEGLITKLYRIGPARQAILKSYVVAGQNAESIAQRMASASWQFKVAQHPRRKNALIVDSGLQWLHTRPARDQLFSNLGEMQAKLASEAIRLGAYLLPSGIRVSGEPWRYSLVPDQHRIEPNDLIEQAVFCNLLRYNAPLLIAATGRAGVDPNGVESIHSRVVLDGAYFPSRAWTSTSTQHVAAITAYLRKSEGIPRLDFLEVTPHNYDGILMVETALMDGQFLLSSVRASALLYQALFLRARRLARGGMQVSSIAQPLFERNRSRIAAFGPQGMLQPGRSSAGQELVRLVEDLKEELQTLEAEFEEFQSLVLGLVLRRLGYPAMRNENDLFRELIRTAEKGSQFAAWMTQQLLKTKTNDLLSSKNHSRQPQLANRIADSWKQWLASPPRSNRHSSSDIPTLTGHRERPGPVSVGMRNVRNHPQDSRKPAPNPAEKLLEALKQTKGMPTVNDRIAVLEAFAKSASPEQLGFLVSRLSQPQRSELEQLLAPGSAKCRAMQPSSALWQDPVASASLQQARDSGISYFAIESAEKDEANLKVWINELKRQTPKDLKIFLWRRRHFPRQVRQELLIVRKNNQAH